MQLLNRGLLRFLLFSGVVLLVASLSGCGKEQAAVVIYTTHDRNLSEPVLQEFTKQTGIEVKATYDTEATKTTGLVNRLIAEQENPQADVFWNNEIGRTIILQEKGVLAPYPNLSSLAANTALQDKAGHWAGFGARARVIIVNTDLVKPGQEPTSLQDFFDPRWKGKAAIANPHFGTTGTHFAALKATWGEEKFRTWLKDMKANDVALLPGNGQVKNEVAGGRYAFGLTDTDDVNGAIIDGKPVKMVFPDQQANGLGVFVIPNTVSLVKGGKHPELGKKLVEFILSAQVEEMLAKGRGAQIPVQHKVPGPERLPDSSSLKHMDADYQQVAAEFENMLALFREEWPR